MLKFQKEEIDVNDSGRPIRRSRSAVNYEAMLDMGEKDDKPKKRKSQSEDEDEDKDIADWVKAISDQQAEKDRRSGSSCYK